MDRRRQRRRRLRPRPRRHLPRVVAAPRLSRRPVVPRLPHLRPPVGLPPGTGHVDPDRARGQGAVRPDRRSRRRRPGRRRLRRPSYAVGWSTSRRPAADRASSWSPTTPSCSGTGGTRVRPSSRRCCACCPRPAYASPPCRVPSPPVTSRERSSSARARGAPARTGGSGTASRSPTSSKPTPACRTGYFARSTKRSLPTRPVAGRTSTSSPARRCSRCPATGRSW